ncbi:MAG TPA: protein-methionine-sulfoxide reductase catalytic subunit MsrP [Acidobacteriota bacterium]|nr:protein-methionine-sulfoxide reductase catalytic subunit MsrP [Acidobacteriota bacterium]
MARQYRADIPSLEPTPREVYFNRRKFVAAMALGAVGASSQFCRGEGLFSSPPEEAKLKPPLQRPDVFPATRNNDYQLPAGIAKPLTPRETAASHNNFYEFLPGRGGPVWEYAEDFEVEPWKVQLVGDCNNPMTLDLDDIFAFAHEERVYHFRCVERWAMNVPWSGFPLSKLIEKADPKSSAKYVRFISAERPGQMPGLSKASHYPWPYHEALRMDEAMNELALAVTGIYGEPLLKQHGAPLRVIVPWKYGYKNPKSIVRIEFLRQEPKTFWQIQPHEYGFLSNVNPNIPHPRWSQSQSYWLRNEERFATPIFNGYGKYVAELYPDEPRTPQRPLRPGEIAR